ncbi:MAG: peptide chain release factor N(5)-glutamine methyltransferase [Firmicutes bacterium]|nr:peptide chain release factor N(5)-glutamine methyltransferase [Bacillota bacterium]
MNIKELLKEANLKLKVTDYGRLEAEVILAHILKKDRVYLHININQELEKCIINKFFKNIDELIKNKPLQYITGNQEWMGLDFIVNEKVLIPREDTRILLEQILALKSKFNDPIMVEIGTGSGILPVLIKKNWNEAKIFTTEISLDTLNIARENFKNHNVEVQSFNCDFLETIKKNKIKADIIFSNPPYISEEEYLELDPGVKKEPYGALVGGKDGLEYYRRLAEEYIDVVRETAYILIELGWEQYEAVREILENKGLKFVGIYKDDGNRNRVLVMEHINNEN